MTRFAALLLLLLAPSLALADVDPRFVKMRDAATPLGGLSAFLEKFVGTCDAMFSGPECKQKADTFRSEARKTTYFMIVAEEQASMLSPGDIDLQTGEFSLFVTPFFPAGSHALTHGAPKKTDRNGNPIMPLIRLEGQLPEEAEISRFPRLFQNRELRVQVIFSPESVWSLAKKGGGRNYGVKAKVKALLITHGRTGKEVASWFAK